MNQHYSWHEVELAIRAHDLGKPYDEGAIAFANKRIGRDISRDHDGGLSAAAEAHRLESF